MDKKMDWTIIDCLKNDIVKQIMCATPLTKINIQNISYDTIKLILMILSNSMLDKYPLKTGYLIKLLKTIINQVENSNNELCDELYLKYVEVIQNKIEEPFYKHYIILNKNEKEHTIPSIITIQESTSIVSQGTTGLCTWQAGVALSIWCLKNKNKLENKFIVELGCGTGLSGISACVNCKPREYWFTDCHSSVLNVLKQNIEINETRNKFNCKYDTLQLSWDNIDNFEIFKEKKPDLVLAADVVYDQTMFESLCNSLKYFIKTNTTEVLLFCTLRNHNTYKEFLYTLDKYGMMFIETILPENYSIILQQECPIHIVNVKQKLKLI